MYSILLVEDEQIVRVALKSLIDWENNGFNPPFEASNGQQALEIIKNHPEVDVVLTDINMPVMDGLELIKELNKLEQAPDVIVLSAYDEYSLVRGAFKLGINDYIIKSQMEPESVLKVLSSTLQNSNRMKQQSEATYKGYQRKAFLKRLLMEPYNAFSMSEIEHYQLKVRDKKMMICSLLIDGYAEIKSRYVNNSLDELTANMTETISVALEGNGAYEVIAISPEEYAVVLSFEQFVKSKIYETIETMLQKVRLRLFHYMNMSVSAGISEIDYGYESLHKLYQEALECAKYRYLLGKGHNIYPEQVRCIVQVDHENLMDHKEPLLEALSKLDKKNAFEELTKLMNLIGNFKCSRIEEMSGYYMELLYIIIHHLHEMDDATVNVFEHNTDFLSMIRTFDTKAEIDGWLTNLVGNLLDYLINNNQGSQAIQKAKEYVQTHYMEKIALSDVSAYLELSEGYFSALFSAETGENFIHYLTVYRIEKAKKMLTKSNMKIYEICEAIGYENVEHFSRVFKKQVGVSPLQYKNR